MRRAVGYLAALWLAAITLAGCGGSSPATPLHVTALWIDGINHGDARQSCQHVRIPKRATAVQCEAYYAGLSNQLGFFQTLGTYRVVAHSTVTWTETYRGRTVEVARVTVYSLGDKTTILHVRLIKGANGWKVVNTT